VLYNHASTQSTWIAVAASVQWQALSVKVSAKYRATLNLLVVASVVG
jgi:hypothetical protein